MFELVPSKWMKKYLEEQKKEFTDWEKATLIWNAPNHTWLERLEALKGLELSSSDNTLKLQIRERTLYEEEAFKLLKENGEGKYIYVVEEDIGYSEGFFAEYETAVEYAIEYSREYVCRCHILKQLIYSKHDAMTKQREKYNGREKAGVLLNQSGEILNLYSDEVSAQFSENIESDKKGRFEDLFFYIPFGMGYGSVKILNDNTYGVLACSKKEWDGYMEKCKNGGLDFSDIQVVVYHLTDKGLWSHKHVNPLYLEPEMPEIIENDEESKAFFEATKALVDYFKYETEEYSRRVVETARRYVEECNKNSFAILKLENAIMAEDIFY